MLGCAGPAWLVKEGIVVPFYAEKSMVALAEKLAEEQPALGAYPTSISGGNTEMADALRLGIPCHHLHRIRTARRSALLAHGRGHF